MSKPKVRVVIQLESPPGELVDFVLWAGKIYESVPADCREMARVELEVSEFYGSIDREWTLTYWRNETAGEEAKRLAANKRRAEAAKIAAKNAAEKKAAEERETYERLKRKFEKDADFANPRFQYKMEDKI